ncbi:MAG TPA: hypothetical protein VKU00_12010, partial [Chthonomonadaceae bacterium]|nr:hypothetical protein [Chthonomonadaceae bacterium]
AASLPGVTALPDEEGREAQSFHAATSGYTLLYDGNGRLLYRGGITSARGHEGANAGQETLLALLQGQQPTHTQFPVFGCSLRN